MGLWTRLGLTAAVVAVLTAAAWQGVEALGDGQGAAIAVSTVVATVAVTLGGVWVSRARGDREDQVLAGARVAASRSGLAVGEVRGPVFGPGSNFAGATVTIGPSGEGGPVVPGGGPGERVVVGEIPQEPPAFQHRPDLLAQLTAAQGGHRVSVVYALTGLRGVGKSQIAAACARRRLDEGWPVVAWLNAEDRDVLLAGFAQLAAELSLGEDGPDSAVAAGRVRRWLEAGGDRCLVVLDNAVSADVVRPFLPAAGRAQVIVTSSRPGLAALGEPVAVEVFTEDEAVRFLAERTGLDDETGALRVAREVGCLPLALAQAGAVVAGQRLSFGTYLSRLAAVGTAYLTRPEADPYPRGTAEAIVLAVEAARADDPGDIGGRLLVVLCLLSPAGVLRSLLAGAVKAGGDEVDDSLGRLAGWSLTGWSQDGSAVTAHRLVLRVVREQAAAGQALTAAARAAIGGLGSMFPGAREAWRYPALMQEYVTQVTALSGHLAAFPAVLAEVEEDLLGLLADAGWYLDELSDITRAVPLLQQVLVSRERVLGADHSRTLTSRNNLAVAYRAAGRLGEAIPLYEQTLADRERVLGADHPDTLISQNNLAYAYREAGRLGEAIPLFKRTVADQERVLGADHPDTLGSRNDLAVAYRAAGRLGEAIPLYEQALADRERVLGADHPDTLASRNDLAVAYREAGRLGEAIPLYEQTLADQERVLGADHPHTLTSRNNLAVAYRQAGRLGEAIPLYEQTLTDRQRALGADHPHTLTSRNNLAYAYREAGRLGEAVPLYEQALADAERVLSAGHPLAETIRSNLAAARSGLPKRP